jgi:Zn-dependent protease
MSLPSPSSYVIGRAPAPARKITTSPTEIVHLLIAFLVLTFDISLIQRGFGLFAGGTANAPLILFAVEVGAAVALTGFVAHELAHKVVAQRYGFWAEFRMSPIGLLISVMTAFVGFLMALPGATMIGGMGDARQWGRTSVAGPLLNLIEGAVFLIGAAASFVLQHNDWTTSFLLLLALFNGIFAAFNLLPFGLLDGRKVFRWNRGVWAVTFAMAVGFALYAYSALLLLVPPF